MKKKMLLKNTGISYYDPDYDIWWDLYESPTDPSDNIIVLNTYQRIDENYHWIEYWYTDQFRHCILDYESKPINTKDSKLTNMLTDFGIDTDGDGLFNYLVANIEIDVPEAGDYGVDGMLHVDDVMIAPSSLSLGLGINRSDADTIVFLDEGINEVAIYFSGKQIYDSGFNGSYNISLIVKGDEYSSFDEFITTPYDYTQFQGLKLETRNIVDYGEDVDSDGLFDYLAVELQLDALTAGNYTIKGSLYCDEGSIDSNHSYQYLEEGTATITFKFDGCKLFRKRVDGPYNISFLLSDGLYGGHETHVTSAYSYTDFQKPKAYFTNIFLDYGTDVDDDSYYDYLTIEAEVYVKTPGNYTILGWLEDDMTSAHSYEYLNAGTQQITLNFDGTAIYRSGEDGPYLLSHIAILDEDSTVVDSVSDVYMTASYSYTDFQRPTAFFQDVYSDYGVDTNENGLYEYLAVKVNVTVESAGNYTLTGGLSSDVGSEIIAWANTIAYLVPGTQSIVLYFDGPAIYQHGINGPYELGFLALFNENGILMDSRDYAYITSYYSYNDFEHSALNNPPYPPAITGPTSGKPRVKYTYTIVTIDPDGDDVYYFIDWGDFTNSGWIGPYSPGEEVTVTHRWLIQGTYTVRAKAKDVYGAESDWSTLSVTMPKNKQSTNQNSQSNPQNNQQNSPSGGSQQSADSSGMSQSHIVQAVSAVKAGVKLVNYFKLLKQQIDK